MYSLKLPKVELFDGRSGYVLRNPQEVTIADEEFNLSSIVPLFYTLARKINTSNYLLLTEGKSILGRDKIVTSLISTMDIKLISDPISKDGTYEGREGYVITTSEELLELSSELNLGNLVFLIAIDLLSSGNNVFIFYENFNYNAIAIDQNHRIFGIQ